MARVIALGFFDGVHIGHQALLERARSRAAECGAAAAVLTFDRHPDELVYGGTVPLITSAADRDWLLREYGAMDEVLLLHFDRAAMEMPWESFIRDYLIGELGACHLVCGHDFHFGARGEGNPERMRTYCTRHGIGCDVIPCVSLNGETVSSTLVRRLLANGEIQKANAFLGHPHVFSGTVVAGKQLGRTIGLPTANLEPEQGVLLPARGVYITEVQTVYGKYTAVTNIGVRPTVDSGSRISIESHLLDFREDLYGKTVRLFFYERLRGEKKFQSVEELKQEIQKDETKSRAFFEK